MQPIDIRDILKASGLTKRVAFSVGAGECGLGAGKAGNAGNAANVGKAANAGKGGGGDGGGGGGFGGEAADCVFDEPLAVRAELANVNGIIRVKANLRASYRTCCARCLKALRVPIDKDFEEEFVDVVTARMSDDMYTYAEKELDMSEALRDAALLEIPIRHLCKEDCKSLCPQCGKDLNEGGCGCGCADAQDGADARFAALLGFGGTN